MTQQECWQLRLCRTVAIISALGLLAAMVAAVCSYAAGIRLLAVQTDSMRPIFGPGDAIVVRKQTAISLQSGDIVSYHVPGSARTIVSHRLITKDRAAATITTKGDNASQADLPVNDRAIIGKVILVAPRLGRLFDWLRRPVGLVLAVYAPLALVAANEVYGYLRRPHFVRYASYRR